MTNDEYKKKIRIVIFVLSFMEMHEARSSWRSLLYGMHIGACTLLFIRHTTCPHHSTSCAALL